MKVGTHLAAASVFPVLSESGRSLLYKLCALSEAGEHPLQITLSDSYVAIPPQELALPLPCRCCRAGVQISNTPTPEIPARASLLLPWCLSKPGLSAWLLLLGFS